jgi:hypothetical protein
MTSVTMSGQSKRNRDHVKEQIMSAAPDAGSTSSTVSHSATDGDQGQPRTTLQVLKDIGLFFAAPFITMAYMPLFPFIGLSLLRKEWRRRKETG